MCFEFDYWVTTDGGALSNGTAESAGYGSYHLESRTGQKQLVRLDFGRGITNNEAAVIHRSRLDEFGCLTDRFAQPVQPDRHFPLKAIHKRSVEPVGREAWDKL